MPYAIRCAAQARIFLSIWLGLCSRAGVRGPPPRTSTRVCTVWRTACPPHGAPHGTRHGARDGARHGAPQVSPATTRINKPLLALTLVRLGFTPQRGRRLAAITNANLDPHPHPHPNPSPNPHPNPHPRPNPDPDAGWRRSVTHSTCSARSGRRPARWARARRPRRERPDRCLSRSR